ncbi:hypothetical protein FRC01_012408, partial [Tulasnella sp. 417]
MMTTKVPYSNLSTASEIKEQILSGRTPEPYPPPQNWPGGLLELVRKCWSQTPEERPTTRMCVESVDEMISLIERMREEVAELLRSSFISRERLQFGSNEALRQAGNCTTRAANLLPSGARVVVKEINLQELPSLSSRFEFCKRFSSQVVLSSRLGHESIIELVGCSALYDFTTVAVVTARMVNGNLAHYMEKGVEMNGKLELARGIMGGLEYLHSREPPVVHGNIAPSNVLISETGKAVLCDVGWGVIDWHPIPTPPKESLRWSSPEVNLGDPAILQSDIWSWACVVLELMTGDRPYSFIQTDEQIKVAISPRRRVTPDAFHDTNDIPDVLLRLLQRCWDFNFLHRPKADECIHTLNLMLNMEPQADQAPGGPEDDDISRLITSVSPQAICINGRFGDVFKGTHRTMGEVALKRLRIGGAALDEQIIRRFEREADTWRRLEHPHVLRFLGTYQPEGHLYFVSPFMQNGTLLEYVHDRSKVNRVKL